MPRREPLAEVMRRLCCIIYHRYDCHTSMMAGTKEKKGESHVLLLLFIVF